MFIKHIAGHQIPARNPIKFMHAGITGKMSCLSNMQAWLQRLYTRNYANRAPQAGFFPSKMAANHPNYVWKKNKSSPYNLHEGASGTCLTLQKRKAGAPFCIPTTLSMKATLDATSPTCKSY